MNFFGAIKAFFGWLGTVFQNQRDNELRKDGARQADIAQRDKVDEIRREAEKLRRENAGNSQSDTIERMRRNKGKGGR